MPPSIASSRSFSVLMIRGSRSRRPRIPKTTTKQTVPRMSSDPEGQSGPVVSELARIMIPALPAWAKWSRQDERRDEADEGERLGQREADPHELLDAAAGLGLAGHGLDRVAEDQADADARADGGEAVSQGTE